MTNEKPELKTRHITVRLATVSKTDDETQHIDIEIIDNKTKKVLKSFDVYESSQLKKVWVSENETVTTFEVDKNE